MKSWMIFMIIRKVLTVMCPYCAKPIAMIGYVAVLAELLFIIFTFIFGEYWWYGLVALTIYFIAPIIAPKVDIYNFDSPLKVTLSSFGVIIADILLVLMYCSLFDMI